jgi:C4-dicarboxylate transporter DctQ subunit
MPVVVHFVDGVSEFVGKLNAWTYFAIGLFITYEIFVRNDLVREYLGTALTIWVDEVSRNMQKWVAYLGAAFVLKNRNMVTIEIAFKVPTSLAGRLAESLAIFMLFIFAGVAVYYGFQLWLKSTLAGHTTGSFLAPPRWLTHASVWVGFSWLFIQGNVELYKI